MKRKSYSAAAFTLVELLVVISIIALLIAVLVPSLSRARKQTQSVACRSNMKQLMNGMFYYIADHQVFPGTHGLFFMQSLFGAEWPRVTGSTWDGARDSLVGLTYHPSYSQPYHLDDEFVRDVPGRGTLFPFLNNERVYRCPSDRPGTAEDSPTGGGGNGRISYSLNSYVGYMSPERLDEFVYTADSLNNKLPGKDETASFLAGQRVVFPPSRFMTLFEEHPNVHMNGLYPDASFNGLDRIVTRHMPPASVKKGDARGRANIAFLDGHVSDPTYPVQTMGRELFTEYGQPYMWHDGDSPDRANVSKFIPRLQSPCPW